MYLKTLTVRGFKSFASATTLRFEPGITCIVGPNGSGKSNIVDALTWVMGEQGAKSLRGANMADVIFAGTSGRPALGRAQVELTIDNSDGRLPIEYSEVTIARTLFRGGNSEYTINGAPVRLLDVQELLSDTGMGKQMHVIVGQGQLDAVLRASPQERREFIDEAAGVLKHRRRKERALRKLGSMDADLLRVVDLTEEIRRQLKPLARQAKAARAAEGIHDRIREAQLRLNVDEYLQAKAQVARDEQQVSKLRETWTGHEEKVRDLEKSLRELDDASSRFSRRLGEVTEIAHQFDSLQERLNSSAALARERIEQEQGAAGAIAEVAVGAAAQRLLEAEAAAERAEAEAQAAESSAAEAEQARVGAEGQHRELAARVRAQQEDLDRHRKRISQSRETALRADSLVATQTQAVQEGSRRLQEATSALLALEGKIDVSGSESAEQTHLDVLRESHDQAERASDLARESLEAARGAEREKAALLAKWQARADALHQALDSAQELGGASAGPKLEQLLRVPRGWELAVSALLQDFEEASVRDGAGDASATSVDVDVRAVVYGEQHGPEGARVPSVPKSVTGSQPAAEVVAAAPKIEAAVAELLTGSWVAADIAAARRVLETDAQVVRVATPKGIVVGRHTVLNSAGQAPSSLELRSQWEEAEHSAKTVLAELRGSESVTAKSAAALSEASERAGQLLGELRSAEQSWARAQQQREEWAQQLLSARAAKDAAQRELEVRDRKLATAKEEAQRARDHLAAAERQKMEPVEDFRARLTRVEEFLGEARNAELEAKLALSAAQERERGARRQAAGLHARHEQLRQDRQEGLRRDAERALRLERLRAILTRVGTARDEALLRGQQAADHRARVAQQAESLARQRARTAEKLERLRWEQVATGEQRQQAEVAISGARLRQERAEEELLGILRDQVSSTGMDADIGDGTGEGAGDDTGVPHQLWEQTLQEYHPDRPMSDENGDAVAYSRESVRGQLREAQRQLQRLGVVNPLAVTEYEAMQDRHKFLQEQIGDLRKSKRDLLEIIADVDEKIQVSFERAFADTKKQFAEVFGTLFPGGTGSLSLTDPDNPLETGVEIYARPAGKRVTRLSLLSGGERSLAALAYLVAIFKARPSPFYVMDEVEAALDDINLSRVLEVMEELRVDSQLIMVTHQKRTMEIADALYGVTMHGGVTEVVSHRM